MNLVTGRLRRELLDMRLARASERLAALTRMAELVHPDRPLTRGYARVTAADGRTLTKAADARAAIDLRLRFADGVVEASSALAPSKDSPSRAAKVERGGRRPYVAPQAGLFDNEDV
jgi:exodeoxyribonuclease VII large subunit